MLRRFVPAHLYQTNPQVHPHGPSDAGAVVVGDTAVRVDDGFFFANHSPMTNDETNTPQPDPLTISELISLQNAADVRGYLAHLAMVQ